MNIGEKIKMLRTSKLMTQSELAGNEITRNMLSRIENGAAQPSLDTLRYLAARLNVSPGFLLADANDERMYMKHNEITAIKTAYLSGDYRICRDICLKSESHTDDEIQLILAECTQGIAIEEFCSGNLRNACEYFDLALEACAGTIYNTNHVSAISAMYFKYMQRISATLSSNYIDENEISTYAAMYEPFCIYASSLFSIDEGADTDTNGLDSDSIYGLHVSAEVYMKKGEYKQAHDCLCRILFGEVTVPQPMLYFVFCDLEICCKEIEDFRGAYEFSIDKIELLQRMLS